LWGKTLTDSCILPFDEVSNSFSEGTAPPSFTASWLSGISNTHSNQEDKEKLLYALKFASGNAFLTGYETTFATLNFVYLMIVHPGAQQKAQEELERVLGRNRLPNLDDRELLPYTSALVKEVLRWYPVLPFGVPHRLVVDDVYNEMDIPKGSIVMSNAWAMSRDWDEYAPDPDSFRPERFVGTKARDPFFYVFGFGRRICPGRYMVMNTLFLAISSILQVFTIGKKLDENGNETSFEPHWENALAVHLTLFPESFMLRFEGAERLINVDD